jgi:hypothetical protein
VAPDDELLLAPWVRPRHPARWRPCRVAPGADRHLAQVGSPIRARPPASMTAPSPGSDVLRLSLLPRNGITHPLREPYQRMVKKR